MAVVWGVAWLLVWLSLGWAVIATLRLREQLARCRFDLATAKSVEGAGWKSAGVWRGATRKRDDQLAELDGDGVFSRTWWREYAIAAVETCHRERRAAIAERDALALDCEQRLAQWRAECRAAVEQERAISVKCGAMWDDADAAAKTAQRFEAEARTQLAATQRALAIERATLTQCIEQRDGVQRKLHGANAAVAAQIEALDAMGENLRMADEDLGDLRAAYRAVSEMADVARCERDAARSARDAAVYERDCEAAEVARLTELEAGNWTATVTHYWTPVGETPAVCVVTDADAPKPAKRRRAHK